jgi:hypothetical protein
MQAGKATRLREIETENAFKRCASLAFMPPKRFKTLVDRNLPRVRVLHPYPHQRFAP